MKKIVPLLLVLLLTACSPEVSYELEENIDAIEVFSDYRLARCTVTIDGSSYYLNVKENNINTDVVGNYLVLYELVHEEETYTCQRMVFVVDETAPTATLNIGLDTVSINDTWEDAGITASDNYSDVFITVEGTVDTTTSGIYQIMYTITDSSDNETILYRNVYVTE